MMLSQMKNIAKKKVSAKLFSSLVSKGIHMLKSGRHIPMAKAEAVISAGLVNRVHVKKPGKDHALVTRCTRNVLS
jgi:hypothetical protein